MTESCHYRDCMNEAQVERVFRPHDKRYSYCSAHDPLEDEEMRSHWRKPDDGI